MKILYDHQIYVMQKFGGINRYFDEIMNTQRAGFKASRIDPVLFYSEPVKVKTDLYSRGLRFVKRKTGFPPKPAIDVFPQQAADVFSRNDFDLFHPTYYDPYFLARTQKPFVLTVYDMIHEIFKEYFWGNDPTSHNKLLLCRQASQIITISHKTKEDLVTIFKIPEEKVHAIPLASTFDQVVAQHPGKMEGVERYLLFTGNRWGYKNFYFPVLALTDLLKADQQLRFVCTGPAFEPWEMQFFKDQGIDHQMHHIYLQNDQELSWVYRHAAAFIFPSLYEGFGFPLLEAFACNCPVISSNGGSLPEVAGEAALYFEPRDFRGLQQAAHAALYDTALRASLINKGQERFKQFSWERCREDTIKVYHKVLG